MPLIQDACPPVCLKIYGIIHKCFYKIRRSRQFTSLINSDFMNMYFLFSVFQSANLTSQTSSELKTEFAEVMINVQIFSAAVFHEHVI